MKGYELVFITDPSISENDLVVVLKKFRKSLKDSDGKLIHEYVWGRRRLAYEISGNNYGIYHAWYFTGSGRTVDELRRQFGYSDDVLRNQIVLTDDLDAEAAYLKNLIPPKEDLKEKKEIKENSDKSSIEELKKSAEDLEVKTDSEDSKIDVHEEIETKSK